MTTATTVPPLPDRPVPSPDAGAIPPITPVTPAPAPAEPPGLEGTWAWLEPYVRPAFITLNRRLMIPLHRAGFAQWIGTPVGGWMLLLRVRGRRSGLVREIPLSYLVAEGSVWVLAGFGRRTEWYRNLLADPRIEVRMPGRRYAARATEELDPAVRERIVPALVRATGLPGFMTGQNPWTAHPDALLSALDWVPLIRVDPAPGPIEPGPDDPGGRGWIWRQAIVLGLTAFAAWGLARAARAISRRGTRAPTMRGRPAPR